MAHTVKVTLAIPEISKVDTCYEIKQNGKKLGTLKISKGGIDYFPKGYSVNKIKKNWTQLHDLLTKSVIISAIVLFTACGTNAEESKYAKYQEQLTTQFKESGKELVDFEKTPGFEDEKKAVRNNTAIGQKMILQTITTQWKIDYLNEFHKDPAATELQEFKQVIKYDSIITSLDRIIAESKQ